MKVSTARIKLVLWTSKTLADGTNPIMLKISFNGQAMLSTHFSCKPKDWNENDECLKKSFPNYVAINKILQDLKNEAIASKLKFESEDTPYTAKMVLEGMKQKDLSGKSMVFEDVMKQLIDERHLKYTTSSTYEYTFNSLANFIGKRDFILTEVTNEVIIQYTKHLEKEHNSNSILAYISKIQSVLTYANNNEITNHYPKKGVEWVRHNHKKTVHHKAISEKNFLKIRQYFTDIENPNLELRSTKDFAVAFYICTYVMFGIAPVDAAKLKLNNFEDVEIKGNDCWKVTTKRSKTNQPLNIIIQKDSEGGRLIKKFYDTAHLREGFIFPILQNNNHSYRYNTEKRISLAIHYVEGVMNKHLKEVAREIDIPPFTNYSERHSFATHLLNEGVNIGIIASALGRDVSGIGCYLQNLTTDEDNLSIVRD